MTTFIVNGQEREISMSFPGHNGIDISADFIGNNGDLETNDDGYYIATEEDFKWWKDVIKAHEEMDALVAMYKGKFDSDDVDSVVYDAISGADLEDQPTRCQAALIEAFQAL